MKKKYCLKVFFILFFTLLNHLYSNAQQQKEEQLIADLSKLPRFSSEIIYLKIINASSTDISYNQTNGFNKEFSNPSLEKILKKFDIISIKKAFKLKSRQLDGVYKVSFEKKEQSKIDKLIAALKESKLFEYVEKLPLHYPMLTPNDFFNYPGIYHGIIHSEDAWGLTTGNSSVSIAIIDDGFLLNHNDLVGKIYSGSTDIPGNGIDDDNNGYIDDYQGWDAANNDNNPVLPSLNQQYFNHGTALSGIIAANTNNNNGISSVGYNCTYIPVKIKNDTSTTNILLHTYDGLAYAIASGAKVICMAWASLDSSQTFKLLCDVAFNNGKVLVAAAGNTGSDIALFPASYNHVISVGATNANDIVSAYSSYNEKVDIMAPGNGIYSTSYAGINQYAVFQGTSASTAIVSGVIGLMISKNPSMSPTDIENCLKNGAYNINLQNPLKIGKIGAGRVNAFDALTCAENPPAGHCNGSQIIYACPMTQFQLSATSFGLNALSWEWILPGGTPNHAYGQLINVSYNYSGYYDIILIGCNAFGCDTVFYQNKIYVGLPTAHLQANNNTMFCKGTYMYLDVILTGTPPFKIAYTDGNQIDTIWNIPSNQYSIPVSPSQITTYSLTYVRDKYCVGTVSGSVTVNPQDCGPCSNSDFEFGNFVSWKGELGKCCGYGNFINGISPNRQTIISGNQFDPYSNSIVPMVCPLWSNNLYSARLGNWLVGGESEKLSKKFIVTPDNSNFTFAYAVFLQDPINHTQPDKPKFEFNLLDSLGVQIADPCAHFDVTAGPATNSWHQNGLLRFTDWQMVGINLSQYIGHPVTVEFKTEDCGLLGHFGYSYIDATCGPSDILITNLCDTTSVVTLSAPMGYNHYLWSPSGDTTQSIHVSGMHQNDTITVSMTNAMGCSSVLKHVINILPKPVGIVSNDTTICLQGSAHISATGAGIGGSYTWSSIPAGFYASGANITVSPVVTTIYKVKVINANGCEADSMPEVKVTILNNAFFDLGNDTVLCNHDTLTLSSPVSGQIQWSSYPPGFSSTNQSIKIVPEINSRYYVLSFNNGSCSFRDSIRVSLFDYQYSKPITSVYYCSGQTTVQLTAPANYSSYYWLFNGDTSHSVTVNTQPYLIYKVAMVSAQGCYDSCIFMLKPIPDPVAFAGNDTLICKGLGVGLSAAGSTSLTATYQWTSVPGGFTSNSKNIFVFPATDTYYVVAVSNGISCPSPTSYDTVFVKVIDVPLVNLGPDLTICKGDSLTLHYFIPNSFNYWTSNPVGIFSTDTSVMVYPTVTTTYFLTVNDSSCTGTDDITVTVKEGNSISQLFSKTYCFYDTIVQLSAPPGYTGYHWLAGGDTNQSITLIHPPLDSTFVVLCKNPISTCFDTIRIHLKRLDTISMGLNFNDSVICKGNIITISANNDITYNYQWYSTPAGFSSTSNTIAVAPNDTTFYYLTVFKDNCSISDSVKINVIDLPVFDLGNDTSICHGSTIVLYPKIENADYLWENGSTDTIRYISHTTNCKLTISRGNCIVSDLINIKELPAEDSNLIPNVITPNGDAMNDYLILKQGTVNNFSINIYNRWGIEVFNTDDRFFKWDGSFKGEKLAEGTYYYVAKYFSVCLQKNTNETGTITILR